MQSPRSHAAFSFQRGLRLRRPYRDIIAEIFTVTATIQNNFPALYTNLSETPLFITYNDPELHTADFERYLDTLKKQLADFLKL